MIFLAAFALGAGLLRLAAPHVRTIAAGRELAKPGMSYIEVGRKVVPIDGAWTPDELPEVLGALQGTRDAKILAVGQERVEALIRAGCPHCKGCKKLFPSEHPAHCDRCGQEMPPAVG